MTRLKPRRRKKRRWASERALRWLADSPFIILGIPVVLLRVVREPRIIIYLRLSLVNGPHSRIC